MMYWIIELKLSSEAFDDFVVGLAVGFAQVAEDMEETNDSIEAEEKEDRVTVVVGHCTAY